MNKRHYLALVRDAENKRLDISRRQAREIRTMYRDIAIDISQDIARQDRDSLKYRYLQELQQEIENNTRFLTRELNTSLRRSIQESANTAANIQISFFDDLNSEYSLGLNRTWSKKYAKLSTEAIEELISGKIYKDNRGLSQRLWLDQREIGNEIQNVITRGIAEKKSAYDLAKDLERYVNPFKKKDWNWGKVYPGSRKQIDYIAQRLARTSISHAYQMSLKRTCKANPFVDGIVWRSAHSHRTCDLCIERDGRTYTADSLPMDHPNGICSFLPHIEKSFDEIADELRAWVDGEENTSLDSLLD